MIECEICHKWFKSLNSHIRIHGVSCREYKALFPNSSLISEELKVKKSQIQKLLRADPTSTFNTPEYIKKHREVTVNSSKWLDSVSQAIKKHRADPNSAYNTPEYTQKQSDSHKEAWANPESGYNSPEFAKSISETVTRRFEDDPTYSKRVGITISELYADPNSTYNTPEYHEALKLAWADPNSGHNSPERSQKVSIGSKKSWTDSNIREKHHLGLILAWANPNSGYNSQEFLQNLNKTGYGKRKHASDGHGCASNYELIFEEWLISHGLEHEPHPRISNNNGKRADQLVNGYYIEIDGMYRSDEFWREKYRNTGIVPIIIKAENLIECLNAYPLAILKEEKN